jgi:hypothetical protein
MKTVKTLTSDELNSLNNLLDKNNSIIFELGQIESEFVFLNNRKQKLQEALINLKKDELELGNILNTKYGDGKINLEKGEIEVYQ